MRIERRAGGGITDLIQVPEPKIAPISQQRPISDTPRRWLKIAISNSSSFLDARAMKVVFSTI